MKEEEEVKVLAADGSSDDDTPGRLKCSKNNSEPHLAIKKKRS